MFDPVSFYDILCIIVLGGVAFLGTFILERTAVLGKIPLMLARKLVHVLTIGICTFAAAIIENVNFMILLVLLADIVLFVLVKYRSFLEINGKKGWGLVFSPIVFIILLLLFPNDRFLIVAPMGLLALADASATLIGQKFGKNHFNLTGEKKSLAGSMAFIFVAFIWFMLLGFFGFGHNQSWFEYSIMAISIALLTAAAEAIGSNGRDNVWIPASTAFILWGVFKASVPINVFHLMIAVCLFFSGSYLAYKFKLLDLSGAVAASLMGVGIVAVGHFSIYPILVFFITSSLLGKLPGKQASDLKNNQPRDSDQVFSNGAVALFLAYSNSIWPNEKFWILYLVACAVACADTWSSEIGIRFGKKPMDIIRLKKVPKGVSGGITLIGQLAAIAGAAAIAVFTLDMRLFLIVAIAGFCGALLDSVLGATLQARYMTEDGILTDLPVGVKIHGIERMNNDLVNFLSIIITVSVLSFFI